MHAPGGATGRKHHNAPPVGWGWNVAALGATLLALVFLMKLLQLTHSISTQSPSPTSLFGHPDEKLHDLYHQSDVVQWWFLGFAFVAAATYLWPRRHRPGGWAIVAFGTASACIALGLATYIPCAPEGNAVIPTFGWVIGIFEGDIELAGPGSRCALAFAPGFELARGLALLLVAFALSLVVVKLAQRGLDRWRATAAADVDLVVGLDDMTLPLIRALARESERRRDHDRWIDERPGFMVGEPLRREVEVRAAAYWLWWLTGLRRGDVRRRLQRRTCVTVIDVNDTDAHTYELRQLGVKVVSLDPKQADALEPFLINVRWFAAKRIVVRRLFAVTPDQQVNIQVFQAAKQVLAEPDLDRHVSGVIPRLFVRLDDEREARQWRIENLPETQGRYFADVITPEGLAARAVVESVLPPGELFPTAIKHVVVVGESSLWLALLEELAWQQWIRYEFACLHRNDVRDAAAHPSLAKVTLLGPNARIRTAEWRRRRAPWMFPPQDPQGCAPLELFVVHEPESWDRQEKDWESVADQSLRDPGTIVIFVDPSAAYRHAAARLALDHPAEGGQPAVLVRSDSRTKWTTQVTENGLHRFAPSLVVHDPTGEEVAPADSMGRLAQQQHTLFTGAWLTVQTDPGDRDALTERPTLRHRFRGAAHGGAGRKITSSSWFDVPEFVREDNIRQHWEILNWFAQTDSSRRWRRVTRASADSPADASPLGDAEIEAIARAESGHWNMRRHQTGWWRTATADGRWDTRRVSPRIVRWEQKPAGDRDYDTALIEGILRRLWATGLAPVPIPVRGPRPPQVDADSRSPLARRA